MGQAGFWESHGRMQDEWKVAWVHGSSVAREEGESESRQILQVRVGVGVWG
jgi:hypothetical protein